MFAVKLHSLLSLASLALIACSLTATPADALEVSHGHSRRGHDSIAKRKRDATPAKRCKARPTSSVADSATAAVATSAVVYDASSSSDSWTSTSSWTSSSSSSWTATSTSAPAASSSSSTSSGTGKGGLAWANGDDDALSQYKTDKISYIYTWSPSVPSAAKGLGFQTMAMLWGDDQVSTWSSTVVAGYADYAMGFNEPNEVGQSNMTPEHGASLWQTYIQPLAAEGYKLISPATSSAPSGLVWMQQFFESCTGCTFDGLAIHWYDVGADTFEEYVTNFHTTFNMDIWVTEYACQNFNGGAQCTEDQVWSFFTATKSWMDSTPWIAAYFPFGVMKDMQGVNTLDQLMSDSGAPTSLGYYFISDQN